MRCRKEQKGLAVSKSVGPIQLFPHSPLVSSFFHSGVVWFPATRTVLMGDEAGYDLMPWYMFVLFLVRSRHALVLIATRPTT